MSIIRNYENISRKSVGTTDKNAIIDKLKYFYKEYPEGALFVIKALVDFKAARSSSLFRFGRAKQDRLLLETEEALELSMNFYGSMNNNALPTFEELMILVKNSGVIMQRGLPSTFYNFLSSNQDIVNKIADINNRQFLKENDLSPPKKLEAVLAFKEKKDVVLYVKNNIIRIIEGLPPQVLAGGSLGFKSYFTLDAKFTIQIIKDIMRAEGPFLDYNKNIILAKKFMDLGIFPVDNEYGAKGKTDVASKFKQFNVFFDEFSRKYNAGISSKLRSSVKSPVQNYKRKSLSDLHVTHAEPQEIMQLAGLTYEDFAQAVSFNQGIAFPELFSRLAGWMRQEYNGLGITIENYIYYQLACDTKDQTIRATAKYAIKADGRDVGAVTTSCTFKLELQNGGRTFTTTLIKRHPKEFHVLEDGASVVSGAVIAGRNRTDSFVHLI